MVARLSKLCTPIISFICSLDIAEAVCNPSVVVTDFKGFGVLRRLERDLVAMAIPLAITADNRGPLVNIATWLTLVAMIIITLTKLATKWTMAGRFQADDGLMIAAGVSFPTTVFLSHTVINDNTVARWRCSSLGCMAASRKWSRTTSLRCQ